MTRPFWRGCAEGILAFHVLAWVVVWLLWVAGMLGWIDFHVCIAAPGACAR